MWNYVKLRPNESPMAQILSRCSNKANISLVIYHLEENHVECATVPPDMVERFKLGNVADMIAKDAEGGDHAILAYDVCAKEVYLVDAVPELPIASAVLLCVVTELLNGNVQKRTNAQGIPSIDMEMPCGDEDPWNDDDDPWDDNCVGEEEPWRTPPMCEDANAVLNRRFRLGRH